MGRGRNMASHRVGEGSVGKGGERESGYQRVKF